MGLPKSTSGSRRDQSCPAMATTSGTVEAVGSTTAATSYPIGTSFCPGDQVSARSPCRRLLDPQLVSEGNPFSTSIVDFASRCRTIGCARFRDIDIVLSVLSAQFLDDLEARF